MNRQNRRMGLDSVEIVMAVEEAFDIRIEDAEAESIRTPRELINLVAGKVGPFTSQICVTHRCFNQLRKLAVQQCKIERRSLAPTTLLNHVFPHKDRRALVTRICTELNADAIPRLERAATVTYPLTAMALLAGAAVGVAIWNFNAAAAMFAGASVAAVVGYLANRSTTSLCNYFPPKLHTIADLCHWLVAHTPNLAAEAGNTWTRDQIAARIREIVIDHLGCEAHYHEDARFIEDLGMD